MNTIIITVGVIVIALISVLLLISIMSASNKVDRIDSTIKHYLIDIYDRECAIYNNITDSTKVPGRDYFVSYFIRYGEMLTRNGKLQMLSGAMSIVNKTDETGAIIADEYSANVGTLYHSSYAIDANVGKELIIR